MLPCQIQFSLEINPGAAVVNCFYQSMLRHYTNPAGLHVYRNTHVGEMCDPAGGECSQFMRSSINIRCRWHHLVSVNLCRRVSFLSCSVPVLLPVFVVFNNLSLTQPQRGCLFIETRALH